jgi:hypothetical protein
VPGAAMMVRIFALIAPFVTVTGKNRLVPA